MEITIFTIVIWLVPCWVSPWVSFKKPQLGPRSWISYSISGPHVPLFVVRDCSTWKAPHIRRGAMLGHAASWAFEVVLLGDVWVPKAGQVPNGSKESSTELVGIRDRGSSWSSIQGIQRMLSTEFFVPSLRIKIGVKHGLPMDRQTWLILVAPCLH